MLVPVVSSSLVELAAPPYMQPEAAEAPPGGRAALQPYVLGLWAGVVVDPNIDVAGRPHALVALYSERCCTAAAVVAAPVQQVQSSRLQLGTRLVCGLTPAAGLGWRVWRPGGWLPCMILGGCS